MVTTHGTVIAIVRGRRSSVAGDSDHRFQAGRAHQMTLLQHRSASLISTWAMPRMANEHLSFRNFVVLSMCSVRPSGQILEGYSANVVLIID
jgi:hypothetical protein